MQRWEYCKLVHSYVTGDRALVERVIGISPELRIVKEYGAMISAESIIWRHLGPESERVTLESADSGISRLGENGWELVSVVTTSHLEALEVFEYFFKRPLEL